MLKKVILIIAVLFTMLGCNKVDSNSSTTIPAKKNDYDTSPITSPINARNLDNYLFRNDVQYVDVRDYKAAIQDGYIASFQFVPFYSLIASFNENEALFRIENRISNGVEVAAGQVGGFTPQYEESETLIKAIFSQDKYIFLVSQSGSESAYVINLLIQLGYTPSLLYNVGGVGGSTGIIGYDNISSNKYFIKGIGNIGTDVDYDLLDDLTPIN